MSEERLMKTPEEVRQKARELLQMPKEEVLTKYMFQEQEIERLKERENILQKKFSDWKKGIEKERKYYLCERTDCCGRIKDSKKYSSLYQENKRLNNIINELEKYINEEYIYDELGMKIFDASELQDKLQELKGSDK